MARYYVKDANEIIDWLHDWSSLLQTAETISSSTWSITPSGTLAQTSESETTTTAQIMLNAGTAGKVYRVTNEVVTNQSRTMQRTIVIRVEQL